MIEKRFADELGENKYWMDAIALTKEEHQVFTNAWRKEIPYGTSTDASAERIRDAAGRIYEDYPEILDALGL